MEISDNDPIMTNGYTILKWAPGLPLFHNDEYEN